MEFMRDGGFGMWLMLAAFVAAGALAARAKPADRARVLERGGSSVLMLGVLGMAMGMVAVSQKSASFPSQTEAIAMGLGELANNGILAAILFVLLQVGALAVGRSTAQPA